MVVASVNSAQPPGSSTSTSISASTTSERAWAELLEERARAAYGRINSGAASPRETSQLRGMSRDAAIDRRNLMVT